MAWRTLGPRERTSRGLFRTRNGCLVEIRGQNHEDKKAFSGYPVNTRGEIPRCRHRDEGGQGIWVYADDLYLRDVDRPVSAQSLPAALQLTQKWEES